MTDIFIKSFNRPFYLDRCLTSVQKFVSGKFQVTILDDGTPDQYLAKIQQRHPEVKIIKSKNYNQKTSAIQNNLKNGAEINGFEIPTDLWIEAAKNGSEYFIMTEEDVWFTQPINVDLMVAECKKSGVNLLKLGVLGKSLEDESVSSAEINEKMEALIPEGLILGSRKFMEVFFLNKFKFFTILYKLGKVDNTTQLKYWSLNSILMGLYKKEYWLEIWKNMHGKVDEKRQLINAAVYYSKQKDNKNFVSRLKNEAMKTTFQSSATNSYHQYGDAFDVNVFNHQINEAWLNGRFDTMQNFPKDFSIDYFEKFLDEKIDKSVFRSWTENFKEHYREIGCNVEN